MRKRKGEFFVASIEGSTEEDYLNVTRELNDGMVKNSSDDESTTKFKEGTEARERVGPISSDEVLEDTISSDIEKLKEKLKADAERRERIAAEEAQKFIWCNIGEVLANIAIIITIITAVVAFLAVCLAAAFVVGSVFTKIWNGIPLSKSERMVVIGLLLGRG